MVLDSYTFFFAIFESGTEFFSHNPIIVSFSSLCIIMASNLPSALQLRYSVKNVYKQVRTEAKSALLFWTLTLTSI